MEIKWVHNPNADDEKAKEEIIKLIRIIQFLKSKPKMKQVLGPKKHKLCEQISGQKYMVCYTNGTRIRHYIAECWIDERNADYVHYKRHVFWATVREGQRVMRLGPIEVPKGY